jgi:cysteine-rich repeat protein
VAKTGSCSDGDPCTTGDACSAGKCIGGAPSVCNDNNPCTTNTCAQGQGCSYPGLPDQSSCGIHLWCISGTCVAAPYCGNGVVDSGEQCDDGNAVVGDGCSLCTLDVIAPPQPGEVLITEVMARPATAANEWVELYSVATHTVDLNGLYLCDGQFCIKLIKAGGFQMKPGEYALLAAVDITASEGAPPPDYVYGYSSNSVSFNNSGDSACLTPDPTCPPASRISSVVFGIQTPAQSYQLDVNKTNAVDAAVATNWCFSKTTFSVASIDKATPKAANSSCP